MVSWLKAGVRTARERARSLFSRVHETEEKTDMRTRLQELHTRTHHLQTRFLQFIKEISGYRVVRVFRNYSAFSIVASSTLLVSASNFAQGQDSDSLLFGYVNGDTASEASLSAKHRIAAQVSKKDNLSLVPLANASNAVDRDQKDDTSLLDIHGLAFENQVMLSTETSSIAEDPSEDGGVKIYTVESGDTVSGIAAANGITINTILWANDLDNVDQIKPGDQIFILPVAGLSYAVKSGDTIDTIAAKFKAEKDKIIAFNSLPANGEIEVGDVIVIPGGQKDIPVPSSVASGGLERRQYATPTGGTATDISSGFRKLDGKAGTGHKFPYGYCTWYLAQKRYVPWRGNAGTWLYQARALGYRTGKTPAVGAIVVTTENRFYGHVALVEKVSGGNITVSEMNYVGWGKIDRRVLSASSRVIKGYIY
ncbi:MAG: LysM peptidoglycan-binding domain-containing protein [Patescibacteria group bacterium]